jgi:hypothetical protein
MLTIWLYEIGYLLQHVATFFQIKRINKVKNIDMVSLDTNIYLLLGTICRIISMWDGVLRFSYLARLEIIISLIVSFYIIWLFKKYKIYSYDDSDLNNKPILLRPYVLIPVIIFLSLFNYGIHDDGPGYYKVRKLFTSIGAYIETVGLLPQLYIFYNFKETGDVSQFYVVFLALSRILRIFFWVNNNESVNRLLVLLVADIVHTILLVLFVYLFFRNKERVNILTTSAKKQED